MFLLNPAYLFEILGTIFLVFLLGEWSINEDQEEQFENEIDIITYYNFLQSLQYSEDENEGGVQ